jgi:hypothetical protein
LKRPPSLGILYRQNKRLRVEGFADANWVGSPLDRQSSTGYCTFLGGNLVTWKSKKQTVVARSNAEAEYRAFSQTASELTWLQHFLREIGFPALTPISLFCDNQDAIHIVSNPVFHERTKHIDVDLSFCSREDTQKRYIPFMKSRDQLADMFMKSLCQKKLEFICSKLGLYDIYVPA